MNNSNVLYNYSKRTKLKFKFKNFSQESLLDDQYKKNSRER